MTGVSQNEAKKLILDAIINPLHQFINGETERNQEVHEGQVPLTR